MRIMYYHEYKGVWHTQASPHKMWYGAPHFLSLEDIRRYYPADVMLIPASDDTHGQSVLLAVRDAKGRVGFEQHVYSSRTAFVGPGASERWDLIIPDRSTPIEEGHIYEIERVVRRINRGSDKRALRFVAVRHHPDCKKEEKK